MPRQPVFNWFRDFSLLGAKVPTGNIRSLKRKFPETFVPGSECSRNIRSADRYTGERTVQVTTSYI